VFPNELSYRAFVLLLNARGWKNAQIADCLNWAEQTVRQTIHRWQAKGLVGLWDATGRGGQQRWQQEDMVYLEQCLQQEQRTYNSRQLAQKLASERLVHSSPDRTRRVLKKRGGFGNA
jgi:transposase